MPRILLLGTLLLLQLQSAASFFLLTIPPYEEECFLIRTHAWKEEQVKVLQGHYQVLTDPSEATPDTVHVFVMDDDETIYFQSKVGQLGDSYQIAVGPNHKYWLCFQNDPYHHYGEKEMEQTKHPDDKDRLIGFGYRLTTMEQKAADASAANQHLFAWSQITTDMQTAMANLLQHHEYMRFRESTHREMVEKTFADIFKAHMLEAGMVMAVAVGQVLYFRRFLETKRFL
jgi:hypothetical protein